MATAYTTIERIEFILQPELTICNLLYSSSEPDNPAWGGGWKTRTFPISETAVNILNKYVKDYLDWSNGREGVDEQSTCIHCEIHAKEQMKKHGLTDEMLGLPE